MLKPSRLYSFLDNGRGFSLYFLEGQKLISDIALLHNLRGRGFHFLRDSLLSSVQLINYLKIGESLGFYIDSDEPYFRFKIEASFTGKMRTLLLPAEFNEFPEILNGKIRTVKMFTDSSSPYTSITEAKNLKTKYMINNVIDQSYQIKAKNIISDESDQSILISKLPPLNSKKVIQESSLSVDEYILNIQKSVNEIFSNALNDVETIVNSFETLGLSYLTSKEISLDCPCSKEQMVSNLYKLTQGDIDSLFEEEESVEVKCDYCKTFYDISKKDMKDH
jgi:molecular chaperone Hsp33